MGFQETPREPIQGPRVEVDLDELSRSSLLKLLSLSLSIVDAMAQHDSKSDAASAATVEHNFRTPLL
eukprot:226181-Amphidinium_carterae.1